MITKPDIKKPTVPVVTKPGPSPIDPRPLRSNAQQFVGQTPAGQQAGTVPIVTKKP